MELFVMKKISAKTKKEYVAVWLMLHDKEYLLSIDKSLIMELLDLAPSQVIGLELDKKYVIM